MSPLTWVACIGAAAFVAWFGWELYVAPLMPDDYDPGEVEWGCDGCQDEANGADELAQLEAMWRAS